MERRRHFFVKAVLIIIILFSALSGPANALYKTFEKPLSTTTPVYTVAPKITPAPTASPTPAPTTLPPKTTLPPSTIGPILTIAPQTLTTTSPPLDSDGDGVPDASDNCPDNSNADQADSDEDGIGDVCEVINGDDLLGLFQSLNIEEPSDDSDGDGLADGLEVGTPPPEEPAEAKKSGKNDDHSGSIQTLTIEISDDSDGDGVPDSLDNCPSIANPTQTDTDDNGLGDACEFEGTPMEIVIVGKEIRKNTRLTSTEGLEDNIFPTLIDKEVESYADLVNYTEAVVAADENIEKVAITDDHITMDYRHPARLFGLIRVDYTLTTDLDTSSGEVEVKKPWWTIFTSGDADTDKLENEIQKSLNQFIDDSDGDGVPDSLDNCPSIANPTQTDTDDNGLGDACEFD
jgi:hypothetical protein